MEQNRQPPKWRETCDPFALPYRSFRPAKILGYPHARNDVFYAQGELEGKRVYAYIKASRYGNEPLKNELSVLTQLDGELIPKLLDFGTGEPTFSVTGALPGQRLSAIVGDNHDLRSLKYMRKYGKALAVLHSETPEVQPQCERTFFRRPTDEFLEKLGLSYLADYFKNAPQNGKTVFCHGDFHYANVLWDGEELSGILDFELAGYGNRDFDIAWALFLRPGQQFLKTHEEQAAFLDGYAECGSCDLDAVRYYMAQCYVHFLGFCADDGDYCRYARTWLSENCASN